MNSVLQPRQLIAVLLAGWLNRQQEEAIEYLRTENDILKADGVDPAPKRQEADD